MYEAKTKREREKELRKSNSKGENADSLFFFLTHRLKFNSAVFCKSHEKKDVEKNQRE